MQLCDGLNKTSSNKQKQMLLTYRSALNPLPRKKNNLDFFKWDDRRRSYSPFKMLNKKVTSYPIMKIRAGRPASAQHGKVIFQT